MLGFAMIQNLAQGKAAGWRCLAGALGGALLAWSAPAQAQDLPTLRVAAQMSGTVNWELQTIKNHGLDREHGFELELMDVAGSPAAQVAFQGGEADVIVSDWIWVARQRAEGEDIAFIPYSVAVGGVMVPEGSDAESLEDLRGEQIGIAGGPLDKGWIIMQAYAAQQGWDLAAETEQVFGAPPIIYQAGVAGEVAAVMNFWHYMAKQEAAGMRHLISFAEAAEALGLDARTPLLGYVVKGETLEEKPQAVAGLAAASRAAKAVLRDSDAEWERLRPIMNAESDDEFAALREGWRAGIPGEEPIDEESIARFFAIMADLGGEELVGSATTLPDGVFVPLSN